MVPVVALVGRHNVGKSTLFNRLTRTKDALVADFPGLTRDRKYGRAKVEGREFICIDTGGIESTADEVVATRMAEQSLLAIEEADVVWFMVDARAGLMPADSAIAKHLRSSEKHTFLVANKIDGIDVDQAMAEFWALGFSEIYPIAASHGHGLTSLLGTLLLLFIDEIKPPEVDVNGLHQQKPIKLAIVGRPNVGKSTLTNRLLGEDRVVVHDMPGTTRDSIYIPMLWDKREYVLIDTAGLRKRRKITNVVEKFSVIKSLQAIEDANVVLLVIDARAGILEQDISLLGFILNSGRSLIIIVNKWDGLSQKVKEQVKEMLDHRIGFIDFVRVHFISALHGSGVGNLFESVREAYDSSTRRVGTAMLTRIMNTAVEGHQPPLVHGRRVKLKYAHAGGYNPPIVVIHGNRITDLPDSYIRYLMNYFRKSLNVMGTLIRIHFKEGDNRYYVNQRNILTPNQMRKRKSNLKQINK